MRPVRSATCTSGEPVSVSWRRCSAIVAVVSGMRKQGSFDVRKPETYHGTGSRAGWAHGDLGRPPSTGDTIRPEPRAHRSLTRGDDPGSMPMRARVHGVAALFLVMVVAAACAGTGGGTGDHAGGAAV